MKEFVILSWINAAFEKNWFYIAALIIGAIYGLGGLVHVGNILGFGEQKWTESPLAWRLGDIFWGILDLIVVIGILTRSPIGIAALFLAAVSQIVVYGIFPNAFAITEEHRSTLKGMVYFHIAILTIFGCLIYVAAIKNES